MRKPWLGRLSRKVVDHRHVVWDGLRLILQADNDFDSDGRALIDEFSEAISACIKDGFDGDIGIASIHASGS